MTDYTIEQLDAMIADLQFKSDADSHTICSVATQLRELLIVTTNSDFIESLIDFFDPTFTPEWGPEYTYGDDADGNRGITTRNLESVNVDGLPDWVPEAWRQAMQEWAMENRTFYL
jgi:hypothetical protein